jgi:hypothetical protein
MNAKFARGRAMPNKGRGGVLKILFSAGECPKTPALFLKIFLSVLVFTLKLVVIFCPEFW